MRKAEDAAVSVNDGDIGEKEREQGRYGARPAFVSLNRCGETRLFPACLLRRSDAWIDQ